MSRRFHEAAATTRTDEEGGNSFLRFNLISPHCHHHHLLLLVLVLWTEPYNLRSPRKWNPLLLPAVFASCRTEYAKEIFMNNGTNPILYNTNIFLCDSPSTFLAAEEALQQNCNRKVFHLLNGEFIFAKNRELHFPLM